jgi:hypothetical protein
MRLVGKRVVQGIAASTADSPGTLFFTLNALPGRRFLVDTDSFYSIMSHCSSLPPSGLDLGPPIASASSAVGIHQSPHQDRRQNFHMEIANDTSLYGAALFTSSARRTGVGGHATIFGSSTSSIQHDGLLSTLGWLQHLQQAGYPEGQPVSKVDILKTAVIRPFGLFEFSCMPFGLKNAQMMFERMMDQIFVDISTSTSTKSTKACPSSALMRSAPTPEKCMWATWQVEFLLILLCSYIGFMIKQLMHKIVSF